MAEDLIYPSGAELIQISQELLPRLTAARPIFDILPTESVDEDLLLWEQEDYFTGLQAVRGLGGEPGRVKPVGANRFMAEPGYFGEFMTIGERQLTRRRKYGTFGSLIDLTDIVVDYQKQLLQRRLDRIEWIGWTLLAKGLYSVSNGTATLVTDSYNFQSFAASVAWGTFATSTPLNDFRAVKLLERGYSVSFGRDARAFMNQTTFNNMIKNTNANDLYGRRTSGLATVENEAQLNALLTGDNLPTIQVYDGNYRDDTKTVQLYIPDNTVIVVGQRAMGEPVGKYRMTRNASNPGMAPGPYVAVKELWDGRPPRRLEVHDGHNGGPVVFHPTALVVMSV